MELLSLCIYVLLGAERWVDALLVLRRSKHGRGAAKLEENLVVWFLENEKVPILLRYAQESDVSTKHFVEIAMREECAARCCEGHARSDSPWTPGAQDAFPY